MSTAQDDPYVFVGMPDKVHTVFPRCNCPQCCPYVKREAYDNLVAKYRELARAGDALFDYGDDGRPMFLELADDWNEAQGLGRPHGTKRSIHPDVDAKLQKLSKWHEKENPKA